jgi:hypothetical protein
MFCVMGLMNNTGYYLLYHFRKKQQHRLQYCLQYCTVFNTVPGTVQYPVQYCNSDVGRDL